MNAERDLDALVHEHVIGATDAWLWNDGPQHRAVNEFTPHYSTDIAAAVTVEQEIARQGREDVYADALLALKTESDYVMGDNWWLATAPPVARCRAALRAVGCEVSQ